MGVGLREGLPGGLQGAAWGLGNQEGMVGVAPCPLPSLRLPPVPPAPEGEPPQPRLFLSEAWKTLIHTEARMHTSRCGR